jgi:Tfp pilus assembly protein PilF
MFRSRTIAIAALLFAVTLALYAPVVGFEFLSYDDPDCVTDNPVVLRGLTLGGLGWAFGNAAWSNWYPLAWIAHMLDVELYGTWAGGHHLSSALLHAMNAALLFSLLASLTGARGRSALVAALFALHPLHVESVAWIAERKDVLSTCFGLLSTWAYARYTRQPRAAAYAASLLLFAAALMAKPMLVTLPFLFLLLDHWPLERRASRRLWLEKLPFFALSLLVCGVTYAMQRSSGMMDVAQAIPLPLRVANATVAYVAYLGDAIWPSGLTFLRPHPYLPETGGVPLPAWQIAAAALALAALSLAAITSRRRYLQVGWLWYLGTLVPVIGLVQVGPQGRADRYTYLALVGLFIIAAWGGGELLAALRRRAPDRARMFTHCALGAAALWLAVLGVVSAGQLQHWRGSQSLFERAAELNPGNSVALVGLGGVLLERGDLPGALARYRMALALAPDSAAAHTDLANALMTLGDAPQALSHYREVQRLQPQRLESHVNLGNALLATGRLDDAVSSFREALQRAPDSAEAHYNLGNALLSQGRLEASAEHYRRALQSRPGSAMVHYNLGIAMASQGRYDEAADHFRRALEILPDYARAEEALRRALAVRDS